MPSDVPAAASTPAPSLPEPSTTAWPFPSTFPQTSGTGRLAGGASLWTDFIYDDYGASSPRGCPPRPSRRAPAWPDARATTSSRPAPADNNGADIFRAGVGVKGGFSYWRVDWVTLADPSVPIAEWTFDTDNNAATGASAWPAAAGVTSPGIDQALVVSSRGAWLVNPVTGVRTDVLANGGSLTVDRSSKSFIVAVPAALLPVSGTWRVRLAAGLADADRPELRRRPTSTPTAQRATSSTAERVYNITFRTRRPGAAGLHRRHERRADRGRAQAALAGTPVGGALGLDGIARSVTGNFWMEDDQADTLAGGDVSKFSQRSTGRRSAAADTTPEPQPTGYSARWYVSRLHPAPARSSTTAPRATSSRRCSSASSPTRSTCPTTYRPGHARCR